MRSHRTNVFKLQRHAHVKYYHMNLRLIVLVRLSMRDNEHILFGGRPSDGDEVVV